MQNQRGKEAKKDQNKATNTKRSKHENQSTHRLIIAIKIFNLELGTRNWVFGEVRAW